MNPREHRALALALPALAMGMVLLEVLAFRLGAAVRGAEYAALVAFVWPCAAGLGAALLARKPAEATSPALARRGAHLAALAGTMLIIGAVGFGWVSQVSARHDAAIGLIEATVSIVAWLLPAFFSGGAIAVALRLGRRWIGRALWLESAGAAATCLLLVPILWMGAPRAALAAGLPFAAAAFLLAYVGRTARPHWAAIATFLLALLALIAGDIGAPWMRMHIVVGGRARVDYPVWTTQGLIAVQGKDPGRTWLAVDKSMEMLLPQPPEGRVRFAVQDLVYDVHGKTKGPVLVIGTAGGRELAAALNNDAPRVDAVLLHAALINDVLAGEYVEQGGAVLNDPRVHVHIGDGSSALGEPPHQRYQQVVVLGEGRFVQTGPRLLTRHDRLFTVSALKLYLESLRQGGTLLVEVPREAIPGAVASATHALGMTAEHAREHMMVCSQRLGWAAMIVHSKPLDAEARRALTTSCVRHGMEVEFPLAAKRNEAERREQLAWLDAGTPATAERPFLERDEVSLASLEAALATLVPKPPSKSKEQEDEETASPGGAAVAAVGAALALLVVLLVLLVPPRAAAPSRAVARMATLASTAFGLGLALCIFSLVDGSLLALGDAAPGWALLVPLSLVGMAMGRLWVDVVHADGLARLARRTALVGTGWLLLVTVAAAPALQLVTGRSGLGMALAALLLLLSGAVLGAPLAIVLRLLASREHGAEEASVGGHLAGWGLGGALAVLVAHFVGLSWIFPAGLVAYLAGALSLLRVCRR